MESDPRVDEELAWAVVEAGKAVERRLDRALSDIKGISFSEYQLLLALRRDHRTATTRVGLAGAVGLTPSGVTRALKPLEKLGFVATTKDDRDARRSLATLTPSGVELVDDATGVVNDVVGDLVPLGSLSEPDRRRVIGFLAELVGG